MTPGHAVTPERWDILCRVVDNYGDAAVLWRLARQLADEHGIRPRLFIDDPDVLGRLVPAARPGRTTDGVEIVAIPPGPGDTEVPATAPAATPTAVPVTDPAATPAAGSSARPRLGDGADVVISGFLARLDPDVRRRLQARPGSVFVQLEHLSAEPWIDACHGLPSPGPDGLVEHYFYPGFTAGSGGLLRERDLIARRDAFLADPGGAQRWLAGHGIDRPDGALLASLFSYRRPPLDALARALAAAPAGPPLILVAPGLPVAPASAPVGTAAEPGLAERLQAAARGRLRLVRIPFLPQRDYDRLLWSCDLNIVRGEDSWVRAVWAGRPLLWQPYPQPDGTDRVKLDAFLARLGSGPGAARLAAAHRWWQAPDDDAAPLVALLATLPQAQAVVARFAAGLVAQSPDEARRADGAGPGDGPRGRTGDGDGSDLASRLIRFVATRRQGRAL